MQDLESSKSQRAREVANIFAAAQRDPLQRLMRRRAKVAAHMAAMLSVLGISHARISKKSGIKPSQLSRQLSGDTNLTLDTISRICDAAGADYDIVFRRAAEKGATQFWEVKEQKTTAPAVFVSSADEKMETWVLNYLQGTSLVYKHGSSPYTTVSPTPVITTGANDPKFEAPDNKLVAA